MTPLPDNTTDRLLAVADIIEFTPERWDQGAWLIERSDFDVTVHDIPRSAIAHGVKECGTTACVAGWAVALTPEVQMPVTAVHDWEMAGAAALGLHENLAYELFDGTLSDYMTHVELADVLRLMAKIPEGERDVNHAQEVLTCEQNDAIFGVCHGCLGDRDDDE